MCQSGKTDFSKCSSIMSAFGTNNNLCTLFANMLRSFPQKAALFCQMSKTISTRIFVNL